jgi:hypothetical protein
MGAYQSYMAGDLTDYEYPVEEVEKAMKHLPVVNI